VIQLTQQLRPQPYNVYEKVVENMGTTVARQRSMAGKSSSVPLSPPRTEQKSIDPEDASRLSFLAYTIEHYNEVEPAPDEVDELVEGLKTTQAKKIAAALRGAHSDKSVTEAANVFRGWIRANAKR
jgi:hypothetical protein